MDVSDPGVAGAWMLLRTGWSAPCRSRLRPRSSPKLFLPVEDMDILLGGGSGRSSTEGLGEFLPVELRVEDLPLMLRCDRVGEEYPEFRELGRKRAVTGEG